MKVQYLAGPYSNPDSNVAQDRFHQLCLLADKLIKSGNCVLAPIIFGHPLVVATQGNGDYSTWEQYCITLLDMSDEMLVYRLPGWENSAGIKAEIALANRLGIPIVYMDP